MSGGSVWRWFFSRAGVFPICGHGLIFVANFGDLWPILVASVASCGQMTNEYWPQNNKAETRTSRGSSSYIYVFVAKRPINNNNKDPITDNRYQPVSSLQNYTYLPPFCASYPPLLKNTGHTGHIGHTPESTAKNCRPERRDLGPQGATG